MRPGENGELIVEGQTEMRLVAHFLWEVGNDFILTQFEPAIVSRRMGYLAFLSSRIEDTFGTSDKTEYCFTDPEKVPIVAAAIQIATIPKLPFTPPRWGRRSFLQLRVDGYIQEVTDLEEGQ